MFSFRVFELNKIAKGPKFTMLHTGNFVFDNEVKESVQELAKENDAPYSLVYYDNTCVLSGNDAAEEVAEQDNGTM